MSPTNESEYREFWARSTKQPYGLCWCGCGKPTTLAARTSEEYEVVRGCPRHYCLSHSNRKFFIAPHVFTEEWAQTPHGAWFMGLWVTDGYLSPEGKIVIALTDKDAVELAARALGLDPVVAVKTYNAANKPVARLTVALGDARARFEKLTGLPAGKKTGLERAPECLKMNPHFWRGAVDGDGWITGDTVGLATSSKVFAEQYMAWFKSVTGEAPHVYLAKPQTGKGAFPNATVSMYHLKTAGPNARKIIIALYNDLSEFKMERKFEKALDLYQHATVIFKRNEDRRELYAKIVYFYVDKNMSAMQIVNEYGVPYYTVRRALVSSGCAMRGYADRKRPSRPVSADQLAFNKLSFNDSSIGEIEYMRAAKKKDIL